MSPRSDDGRDKTRHEYKHWLQASGTGLGAVLTNNDSPFRAARRPPQNHSARLEVHVG